MWKLLCAGVRLPVFRIGCARLIRAWGRTRQHKTAKAMLVYPLYCTCRRGRWTRWCSVVRAHATEPIARLEATTRNGAAAHHQCTDDMPPLLRRQRSRITKAKLGLCEIAGGLEQGKAKATFCSEQTIVRSDSAFRSPNAQQLCLYRYTVACRQANGKVPFLFLSQSRESSFPVCVCQPHDNSMPKRQAVGAVGLDRPFGEDGPVRVITRNICMPNSRELIF